jgi:membrane protein YdbS with pleckstrin-like domain
LHQDLLAIHLKMRYKFNNQAAIWTFVAVILVWVIAVGVSRFENQRELPLIGSLVYGILGLFASIITGLFRPGIVRVKKKNHNLNEKENENERRLKNGKSNIRKN